MPMYQHYKPLRNLVRTLELEHSLTVIWELSDHLVNGGTPPRIRGVPPFTDLRKIIRPYQILLLCREVLLNANGPGRRSLSEWKDLGSVLDSITRYGALVGDVNPDNVQMMLHRVAQQQLPLQRPISIGRLMRYVHVYLNPEVAPLLQRTLDITAREFTFLGIATYTQIAKNPRFVTQVDLTSLGISNEARDKFYARMTSTLASMRASLKDYARFDHTWEYTFNPISDRPLINVDPSHPERVYGPNPERMLTRFNEGTFFILYGQPNFSDIFGRAFESHIFAVLSRTSPPATFNWQRGPAYQANQNKHHGTDFILTDATANVFVECKTKRLNLAGQVAATQQDLDAELSKLADAIVQNYANIEHYLQGGTPWPANGLPSVNLVITLEDWLLITPDTFSTLASKVETRVQTKELSHVLQSVPYAIASSEAFEAVCCALQEDTLHGIFGGCFSARPGEWQLAGTLQLKHSESFSRANRLFADEFRQVTNQLVKVSWPTR
jgi:hypothetical protein